MKYYLLFLLLCGSCSSYRKDPNLMRKNCVRLSYLDFIKEVPLELDKCRLKEQKLRAELAQAKEQFKACVDSSPSFDKERVKNYKEKSLSYYMPYVEPEQIERYCRDDIWEFLGEMKPKDFKNNGKLCVRQVEIKKSLVKNCRYHI